jgi:hypothetical protein
VWFSFVPDFSGSYEFSTCVESAALDTTIAVFDGCPGDPAQSGVLMACNDDDPAPSAGSPCPGAARLSRVSVRLEAGRGVAIRVAGVGGAQGSFMVVARYARPANDLCANAQVVTVGTYAYDNLGAESDPITADASCGLPVNPVLNDVWFSYTPPVSGTVTASVCNSTFDTVLLISHASFGCDGGSTPVVACNDDYDCDNNVNTSNLQSQVSFAGAAGQAYLIRIGSRVGQRGAGELRVTQSGLGCPCDWNHVGGLTIQDLFDFLNSWFAGAGDFNNSGQTTLGDIFDFLGCFLSPPSGCTG